MHKGINTTADEGQTPIIQHGGGFDGSEDGTGRGTPIVPVQHPCSIMPMNSGKDYKARPTDVAQPIMAGGPVGGNQGGDVIALQDVRGMDKAQNGKGWSDDGTSYTVDALATQGVVQPVAFAQNTRDEVRLFNGDGSIAGALAAEPGMKQTTYVAQPVDSAFTFNTTQLTSPQNGQDLGPDKPCHSLAAKDHPPAVAFDMRGREGGAMPEGPHDTANIRAASGGSSRSYAASQAWGVRRLTPRECERLQGFPDGWTAIPWGKKVAEECPDGPRYKALGNSMAVNVMCWIGERIEAVRAVEVKGEGDARQA